MLAVAWQGWQMKKWPIFFLYTTSLSIFFLEHLVTS